MTEIEMYKNYMKKLNMEDNDWLTFVDKSTGEYDDFMRDEK